MQRFTALAHEIARSANELINRANKDRSVSKLNLEACRGLLEAANTYLSAPNLDDATSEFLAVIAALGPLSGL